MAAPMAVARRALLRALGLFFGPIPPSTPSSASASASVARDGEGAAFALARRRAALSTRLENVRDEEEVARLCELRDALAVEMSHLPTPTLAVALIKLWVVREEYFAATAHGFDKRLFDQALLATELEVRRTISPRRDDSGGPA